MKKVLILFLLVCTVGFGQVPNTTTFTLQDIYNAIPTGSGNLLTSFIYADVNRFDPNYNKDSYAPANSMLRFRNYGALHYLGEQYGGGTVVYVDGNNHGLICSNVFMYDGGSPFIRWYNGANRALCYTFQSLGTGNANTNNIISVIGASGVAATLCKAYRGGGYSDWYLPSQDETGWISYVYRVYNTIPGFINGTTYVLWTSTEDGVVYAISYNIGSPYIATEDDYNQHYVRAMRSF